MPAWERRWTWCAVSLVEAQRRAVAAEGSYDDGVSGGFGCGFGKEEMVRSYGDYPDPP